MSSPVDAARQSIVVTVVPAFMPDESDMAAKRYVFAYTITIANSSGRAAKLLNRHWIITDGDGGEREVRGPGVVGEQPYLRPGEQFRYTSGAILTTQIGSMHGSYEFSDDDGASFLVPIPMFTLAVPNVLH